jgi:hypothetical protein
MNSYTLEATFYAPYSTKTFKKKTNVEEDLQTKGDDLVLVGIDFMQSLVQIM